MSVGKISAEKMYVDKMHEVKVFIGKMSMSVDQISVDEMAQSQIIFSSFSQLNSGKIETLLLTGRYDCPASNSSCKMP